MATKSKKYDTRIEEFFETQREKFGRSYDYWVERWRKKDGSGPKYTTICRWARGDRRIGPNNRHVFKDLPFTMDEYYAEMAPSDQTQKLSYLTKHGRARAGKGKGKVKERKPKKVSQAKLKRQRELQRKAEVEARAQKGVKDTRKADLIKRIASEK